MLKVIASVVLLVIVLMGIASYWVSRPVFNEKRAGYAPNIAPLDTALTFARSPAGLVLVTGHKGDTITGINLTALFGEEKTADLIAFAADFDETWLPKSAPEASFAVSELIRPLDYAYPYIAVGTNFKDHAEEVYVDDPPFLFPKLALASNWQDPVPFTRRLDFEAELVMFPLADIRAGEALPPFGLVLGNDFTDRLKLVKGLKLGRPLGETGFAAGKGCAGCMPTGYLVVIPRSPDFYLSIELSLYVNDELRQRFGMKDVILPIEAVVAQAFEKQGDAYDNEGTSVSLLPQGKIPRGTLILTGTAAGVIFKPLNIWNQSVYLQPGDVVRTEASFLGHLEYTIIGDKD